MKWLPYALGSAVFAGVRPSHDSAWESKTSR